MPAASLTVTSTAPGVTVEGTTAATVLLESATTLVAAVPPNVTELTNPFLSM